VVEGDRMKGSGFDFPIPSRYRNAVGTGSSRGVVAGFRPEHLELGGTGERLTIRAKADVVEYLGNEELLHLTVAGHEGDVIAVVSASHNVRPGDILDLQLPADRLHLFDAESGDAIPASTPSAATASA
jgi:ABC-type sugar transport system ATPase subunit